MAQFFKGTADELKYFNSVEPQSDTLSNQKDIFFDGAYACFVLGEVLYDNNYAPLANAIPREVYRETFSAVFEAFIAFGSFESYLTVFRKIFGDGVEVEFVVPNPGHLQINITAANLQTFDFVARSIEGNGYIYDNIVDDEGDQIIFRAFRGLESQYELEQMLFELVPDGIFTEIDLDLGE